MSSDAQSQFGAVADFLCQTSGCEDGDLLGAFLAALNGGHHMALPPRSEDPGIGGPHPKKGKPQD